MDVLIITTGGTIEGLDYSTEKEIPESSIKRITIGELVQKIEIHTKYTVKTLFSKDSRFITKKDRELLLETILKNPNYNVLVTHGTFTMIETARFLGEQNLERRTIILTGAFISGKKENTDALTNLEFAISQFKTQKSGVYIAMKNQIFDWDNVRKNIEKNKFETL